MDIHQCTYVPRVIQKNTTHFMCSHFFYSEFSKGAGFQGRKEIAALLLKHGVRLRDKHVDGYEPAIRSCWGPEERHTETVEWFLDNGVPLDDIYDACMERGSDRTKQLLESRKSSGSEL